MSFIARARRHVTYANVVSSLCLFLVLGGGTAVALSGSNTVFSDDIKDGEVKTGDVANRAISNPKLGNNSVTGGKVLSDALTGADLRNNSVTGDDVEEGSLGQVFSSRFADNAFNANNAFSAQSADSATNASNSDRVDGLHARTLQWDVAEGAPGKTLFNLHGLQLQTGACPTGDADQAFDVLVFTDTDNSFLRKLPGVEPDQNDDMDVADGAHAVKPGNDSDGSGIFVYHRGTGGVVTANIAWSKTATRCFVFGTVLGGSGTQDVP